MAHRQIPSVPALVPVKDKATSRNLRSIYEFINTPHKMLEMKTIDTGKRVLLAIAENGGTYEIRVYEANKDGTEVTQVGEVLT